MLPELIQLLPLVRDRDADAGNWLEVRIHQSTACPDCLWQQVDSTRFWGGAGSIANLALADNPGKAHAEWNMETREFRTLMISIGEQLMARDTHNPDISSWLLAYHNWNNSEQ